jgi:hypothetical protein
VAALPNEIPTVRVTGTYRGPDGRALKGTVTFTGPPLLTFSESDLFIAGPVVASLDESGQIIDGDGNVGVRLPATDAPNMNPTGWTYTVKENLTGVTGARTYSMVLPKDTLNNVVDLADVAPADPTTPNYVAVPGPSAYEVAVAEGFTGTEDEWLASLEGPQGPQGPQGIQGVSGPQGIQGPKGDTGAQGIQGVQGPAGPEGDSAYEVAVANGFVGTEAEWLASLEGPQGPQGPAGQNGTGSGTVTAVNAILPDAGGNVTLDADDVGALPSYGGTLTSGFLNLDVATLDYRSLTFKTAGVNRWVYQVDNAAEGGADAGSNFELSNWTDAGAWKSSMLYGQRSTGNLGIGTNTLTTDAKLTVQGGAALRNVGTAPATPTGAVTLYSEAGAFKVVTPTTRFTVVEPVPLTQRGAVNGVATLDATGRIPVAQVPTSLPKNTWTPQALGFQAWSVDPGAVANPTTLKAAVVGRIYLCGINITETTSVNRVVIMARGWAGSTAVPAARFFGGIYNEAGSRVAWTGATALSNVPAAGQDANSAPGAKNNHIGAVPLPLTASYSMAPGRYWVAFLLSAGSATDFYYMHIQNEAPSNPSNFYMPGTTFHRSWCIASGQTTLPATVNQATGEVGLDPAIMAVANV